MTPGGIAWELPDLRGAGRASALRGAGALCLMAAYASALSVLPRSRAEPPATLSAPLVMTEQEIDLAPAPLEPEPEPPPPHEPESAPEPSPVAAPTARAAAAPAPSASAPSEPSGNPPPPAQAASVVAAEAPSAPVDFTGFDMTTGAAERYAGGITASSGTNTRAVHAAAVDPNARPDGAQGAASQARPVRLPARNWRCAWPTEADSLGIDAQTVVLRAVVGADGRALSVDILADPGHGFGAAALPCARNARFEAALDASGQPYVATSPPIRVRFTR
ncbi:MAG: energy transducer TonB [Sandaracinaceae bacterium]|nr:energy transducer TonB [Sandaracinaceae bacterium]